MPTNFQEMVKRQFQGLAILPLGGFLLIALVAGVLAAISPLGVVVVGLFAIVVVLNGLILIFRPNWIVYGTIFLIPLISGVERGRLLPGLRPNEPLLLIIVGMFILSTKKVKKRKLTQVDLAIGVYLFFGSILPLLTYLLRTSTIDLANLMPLLAPWQYVLLYWLIVACDFTLAQARRCLQLLTLAGAIIAVIAILQMIEVEPVISFLRNYYYSGHLMRVEEWGYPRTTSLLANWHGTGVYLSFSALAVLAYHLSGSKLFPGWLSGLFVLLLITGMITTTSITSIVIFGLGTLLILLINKKAKARWLLLLIPLIILTASFLFRNQISAQLDKQFRGRGSIIPKSIIYRIDNWREEFLPIVREYWLFGYGAELPETLVGVPSEDSQFIYMLLKGGVFYVMAFLVFIGVVIRRLSHFYKSATLPLARDLFLTAITLFVVIVPACFLQAYMTYSGVAEYLWILLGLSISVRSRRIPAGGIATVSTG